MVYSPLMQHQIEKLAEIGIVPVTALALSHYVVFARDSFAALVEHRENRFVSIGTSGIVTEGGLSMLMWRGDTAWVVSKTRERQASDEEVAGLRQFSTDLSAALQLLQ
ncbi:MAG: hypothetical protein IT168_11120 [Bryobacterales bacterium]|nr:hypothetical protein [Bryobacterales bacterium]